MLKDASVVLLLRPSPSVPPRPGGSRVIAFSLFGAHPRYCETAILNAAAAPALFAGWTCRFYADASVPPEVLQRLREHGAQVMTIGPEGHWLAPTMWRFLALDDPDAQAVICRDADSLLNRRDAEWVRAWVDSARPYHIVRDYFTHTELILAGLFGVRGGVLQDIETTMREWLSRGGERGRWTDQYFLRACLWPLARDAALTHDTWYAYGRHLVSGIDIVADPHDHVGANHNSTTMQFDLNRPDGCPVRWRFVDASGAPMTCAYAGIVRDCHYSVEIPRSYGAQVRSGAWSLKWETGPEAGGVDQHSNG